eukprot:12920414-Prorocentrum_lima.AAC.1
MADPVSDSPTEQGKKRWIQGSFTGRSSEDLYERDSHAARMTFWECARLQNEDLQAQAHVQVLQEEKDELGMELSDEAVKCMRLRQEFAALRQTHEAL